MQTFIMTSHSTLPHVIKCMQGGAYDFFEKPLKMDDILRNGLSQRAPGHKFSPLFYSMSGLVTQAESYLSNISVINRLMSQFAGACISMRIWGHILFVFPSRSCI